MLAVVTEHQPDLTCSRAKIQATSEVVLRPEPGHRDCGWARAWVDEWPTCPWMSEKHHAFSSPALACPLPSPGWHTQWLTSCSRPQSEVHAESGLRALRNASHLFFVLLGVKPSTPVKSPHRFWLFRPLCNPHFFFFEASDWTQPLLRSQFYGTELRAQKQTHTHMDNWFMTKEQRTYSGERMVSSITGVGKAGQLHGK